MIIGHSGAGKTHLSLRFSEDLFPEPPLFNSGVAFKIKPVVSKANSDLAIKLQIVRSLLSRLNEIILEKWDSYPTERGRSIIHSYYRSADGVLVCFDITDQQALYHLQKFHSELVQCRDPRPLQSLCTTPLRLTTFAVPPCILVGLKSDLAEIRHISTETAETWAAGLWACPYMEARCVATCF